MICLFKDGYHGIAVLILLQEPDSEVPTAALGMAVPTCCELVAGERPMTSAASARRPASALGDSFMSTMGLSPAISGLPHRQRSSVREKCLGGL